MRLGAQYKGNNGETFSVLALFETMSDDVCVLLETSISMAEKYGTPYRYIVCFLSSENTEVKDALGTQEFSSVDAAIAYYAEMMVTELAFDS